MTFVARKMAARWTAAVLVCLACAAPALAQSGASLTGRVTDRSSGEPLKGVEIALVSERRSTTSDSLGQYAFLRLPPGVQQFVVRLQHFPPHQIIVELLEGQDHVRPIVLDSTAFGRVAAAQSLPPVGVTARAPIVNYRMVAFERRRQNGRGQYLTEEQIIRMGAYSLADAVKNLRGVTYECGGGYTKDCFIRMARAPMRCRPEFVIDDQVLNDFGPDTPIRDVIGIEVYTGPSEVPGEYAGRNAGCGVVVVWTRSGPGRVKKDK